MNSTPATDMSLVERLGKVRVGVRAELEISRQLFRGRPAYIVRDPITFQTHKLSASDYQVFTSLSTHEELQAVFARLCREGILDSAQEQDFYEFILHLNRVGLLTLPISQGKSLYERFAQRRKFERRARWKNLLFLRVPLFQPDAWLTRTIGWIRPLFSLPALVLWLLGLLASGLVVVSNWDEFRDPLATMLALQNLPLLWFLLVGLKAIHELGHAYACKHFGGHVPEMGAYFILFTPCAYVDASSSWGFSKPRHRVVVGLAGMYFESIAAMAAVVVWMLTGPGMVHSAAQYAVVLATVVTVGFNANPLMRYDGYYVFSDLVGMPNLRRDACEQFMTELKRGLFGIDASGPARGTGARLGLALFGAASQLYRLTVLMGICVLLAFKIPALGIGAATLFILQIGWGATSKLARYLAHSPEVAPVRRRAIVVTLGLAASGAVIVAMVPMPGGLLADGVLRRETEQIVYARVSGVIHASHVTEGQRVQKGQLLCEMENPELQQAVVQAEAQVEQLHLASYAELDDDLAQAISLQGRANRERELEQKLKDDAMRLQIHAPCTGTVVDARPMRELGRFVRPGDALAMVYDGAWTVRAVISSETMALAHPRIGQTVDLKLKGDAMLSLRGTIRRIAPTGSATVEYASLTHIAGGSIAVDTLHHRAAHPYFELVISLNGPSREELRHGMTVYVKLGPKRLPLGKFIYLRCLQLLNRIRTTGW